MHIQYLYTFHVDIICFFRDCIIIFHFVCGVFITLLNLAYTSCTRQESRIYGGRDGGRDSGRDKGQKADVKI